MQNTKRLYKYLKLSQKLRKLVIVAKKKNKKLGQISLNSGGNAKRLARNLFGANFDRWFRKRVSANALPWDQSSKFGSSIIDFQSEKVLWHENNDFKFFDLKNSWATSKTRVTNGSLRRLFFVTSRRISFRVSNEDRKFMNFFFATITNFLSSWTSSKYLYRGLVFCTCFHKQSKYKKQL